MPTPEGYRRVARGRKLTVPQSNALTSLRRNNWHILKVTRTRGHVAIVVKCERWDRNGVWISERKIEAEGRSTIIREFDV
jgi:hypothetical protein